jgi:hypothetical protein
MSAYMTAIVPELEKQAGKPFDQIPVKERPALGLVVGGFSHDEFLSEVWHVVIPLHETKGSAEQARPQGSFGTNWFAMFEPIRRYIKGFDPSLMDEVVSYFVNKRGTPLNPAEEQELREMLDRHEYPIPFGAMPMEEGIEHARFLAELVVNHHRFVVGAPLVGGRINVGSVTYRRGRFRILGSRS